MAKAKKKVAKKVPAKKAVKKAAAKKVAPKKAVEKKTAPKKKAPEPEVVVAAPPPEVPKVPDVEQPPYFALVLDTETTGLIDNHTIKLEKQPHVIEFYGAVVDLANYGKSLKKMTMGGSTELIEELDLLIKPPRPLSDKPENGSKKTTTAITGITNEMLEGQPSFSEVAPRIRDLIEKVPLVIAHNASYDREVLDLEFERIEGSQIGWPRVCCSVEQSVCMKGYRLSLTNLHIELFGGTFPEAHRAKTDVIALIRCCAEMYKRDML